MGVDSSQIVNYKCVKGRFSRGKEGLKIMIEYYDHGSLIYKIKNIIIHNYHDIIDLIRTIIIEFDDDDFAILTLLFITYALSTPY